MIQKHVGDLLAVPRGILVHGCNARGVMGSGIARSIREQFPLAYEDYLTRHKKFGLRLGDVILTRIGDERHIASAITQESYGRDPAVRYVSYDAIEQSFKVIALWAHSLKLPIHFPLIGCGLANGEWPEVARRIERAAPEAGLHLWVQEGALL